LTQLLFLPLVWRICKTHQAATSSKMRQATTQSMCLSALFAAPNVVPKHAQCDNIAVARILRGDHHNINCTDQSWAGSEAWAYDQHGRSSTDRVETFTNQVSHEVSGGEEPSSTLFACYEMKISSCQRRSLGFGCAESTVIRQMKIRYKQTPRTHLWFCDHLIDDLAETPHIDVKSVRVGEIRLPTIVIPANIN